MVLGDVIRRLVKLYQAKRLREFPVVPLVGLALASVLFVLAQPAYAQSDAGPCASGSAVEDADNNPGLVSDCEALLAARDILAGTATLNWSAHTPFEQWEGITLAGSPLRVTGLGLRNKWLTGQIPGGLSDLANLETLRLPYNQLTGEIPTEVGNLANLEILDLSNNQLEGPIPQTLGMLTSLKELILTGNQLTGAIPVELGSLSSLRELHVNNNLLAEEMPLGLTGMSALQTFVFYENPRLCAPIDDAFQAWLQGVSHVRGSSCTLMDSAEDKAVLTKTVQLAWRAKLDDQFQLVEQPANQGMVRRHQ